VISAQTLTKLYGDFTAVRASLSTSRRARSSASSAERRRKDHDAALPRRHHHADRGTIAIAGHTMHDDPIAAKRALAFIPDEPHLFEYLSVEEHLRFIARMYGVPTSRLDCRCCWPSWS
jgi:ABC-2 type transport system ATP-binding protein